MRKITSIRKELLMGMAMLEAARGQGATKKNRGERMLAAIALAEVRIEKAKALITAETNPPTNEQ